MALLADINSPSDLKRLNQQQLTQLAAEVRAFLVEHIAKTGGHLSPNLGVVELTFALHRVFDSPRDAIVWDTGHQAYVHKIVTGRLGDFATLRRAGGLSGYPSRGESEHDVIENSHASTSLSYALGIAEARLRRGQEGHKRLVQPTSIFASLGLKYAGPIDGHDLGALEEVLTRSRLLRYPPVIHVVTDKGRGYGPAVGDEIEKLHAVPVSDPRTGVPL